MGWQETRFERDRLYAEVWAEPVRTVADRYGLSDVGLRKICHKLGVPTPPLGYWARVDAGKAPRVAPLRANYQGITVHVRRQYVDETAPELERRVKSLLAKHQPDTWPVARIPESLDGVDPVLRRMAKALTSRSAAPSKLLCTTARDVFAANVSLGQRDRALRVLKGCLDAFGAAEVRSIAAKSEGPPIHLQVFGQFISFKIEELVDRTLREPTARELAEQEKHPWVKPDLRVSSPNGKLKLTVLSDNRYSPFFSVSDGASPIDDRLGDVVERVFVKSAVRAVQEQMRDEAHKRWEQAAELRRAKEATRDAELKRLKEIEQEAHQWHRAKLLREYATALVQSATEADTEHKRIIEVAWIRNAADWLDPLVAKYWEDVDVGKS